MDDDLRCHMPFHFVEVPVGKPFRFDAICRQAGMRPFVTTARPPQIHLHRGRRDLLAPLPGRNVYCLARSGLPTAPEKAAFAAIERLAYGGRDWAAMETLRAHRRRVKHEASTQDEAEEARREVAKMSLPLRRLLRANPDATDEEVARKLDLSLAATARLRAEIAVYTLA